LDITDLLLDLFLSLHFVLNFLHSFVHQLSFSISMSLLVFFSFDIHYSSIFSAPLFDCFLFILGV